MKKMRLLAGLALLGACNPWMFSPARVSALTLLNGCGGPSTTSVYSLSAATLEACGFTVYPLDHVATRGDGGHDYYYRVGGNFSIQSVPPTNFDPTTASDQDLRAYGLPLRPTGPSTITSWVNQVRRMHHAVAPPFVVGIPSSALGLSGGGGGTVCSTLAWCWGGYVATAGATFNKAYMDYHEPTEASTLCSGDAVATWTGVGESPLGQAGTLPHVGGGVLDHTMFWEVWPNESTVQLFTDHVAAGDDIQVTVQWLSGSHEWSFEVYDTTTSTIDGTYDTTNAYSSATAEWIVERPQSGTTIDPLRNFSTFSTISNQANGIGMQNYTLSALNIINKSSKTLETTGTRSTDHYSAAWNACG